MGGEGREGEGGWGEGRGREDGGEGREGEGGWGGRDNTITICMSSCKCLASRFLQKF